MEFKLSDKKKLILVYSISLIYIAINVFFVTKEIYYFFLLPVFLLLIYYYFFRIDVIIWIVTFFTPIAINLQAYSESLSISLPTEPLMFGILIIFVLKLAYDRQYDKKVLKHPITKIIILNIVWIFITSFTSELPIVSFKFLLSRLWFVVPFYFVIVVLFKKTSNIKLFVWLYIIPLIVVVCYSSFSLYSWGFEEKAAHWVMTPFYNDHTAYGSVLAFFVPITFAFLFDKEYKKNTKFFIFIALIILLIGLILSYSRAAWISLVIAGVFSFLIVFKVRLKWIISGVFVLVALFFINKTEIIWKLEKNKQDSSTDLAKHIQSISNISTDASNLERINRWNSAFRLFSEHPFLGCGPGTYQFLYAPYQHFSEKTIISTNAGDRGNAHSEYIGPLTEQGVIGFAIILALVISVIYTGLKVYLESNNKEVRLLSMALLSGLNTYFIHGSLNNFLDTDKASVPFWGFIAAIVALDVYHRNINTNKEKDTLNENLN